MQPRHIQLKRQDAAVHATQDDGLCGTSPRTRGRLSRSPWSMTVKLKYEICGATFAEISPLGRLALSLSEVRDRKNMLFG